MDTPPDLLGPVPILHAGVGEALFARCADCHTIWPVAALPMEARAFARAATKARCPYCGGAKSFVSPHPLELLERPTRA